MTPYETRVLELLNRIEANTRAVSQILTAKLLIEFLAAAAAAFWWWRTSAS